MSNQNQPPEAALTKTPPLLGSGKSVKVARGYSISKEFELPHPSVLEEGAADGTVEKRGSTASTAEGWISNIFKRSTMGGTVFDGFLLAASQEVGYVLQIRCPL